MSTLTVTNPTLLEITKATDPNGSIATIVGLLAQSHDVLQNMT